MLHELGNIHWDLFAGFSIPVAPNGPTTGDPVVVASDAALTTAYDGRTLTVTGIPEADGDFSVTVTQPADDPFTEETEQIEVVLHFTTSHSEATNFVVGDIVLIPR